MNNDQLKTSIVNLENKYNELKLYKNENKKLIRKKDSKTMSTLDSHKESVLLRFSICWECVCSNLKTNLEQKKLLKGTKEEYKLIIKLAFDENLISIHKISNWNNYRKQRNKIIHNFDFNNIDEYIGRIPSFIEDSIEVHYDLTKEPWEFQNSD